MRDLFVHYAFHLDQLREEAGITIKKFCEGVCEPRTYRYYLSGQRTLSQDKLILFCKKLGFNVAEFYRSYNAHDTEEYQFVIKLYMDLKYKNYEEARKKLIILDQKEFTNISAKYLYEFCVIDYNYQRKTITKDAAYDQFVKLIDYPNCLNKSSISYVETATIMNLCKIEYSIGKRTAREFLVKLLFDPTVKLVSSLHREILPNAYAYIAQQYGMDGDTEMVIRLCERGIKYCLANEVLLDLNTLHYYLFFAYYTINDDRYKDLLFKFLSLEYIKYGTKGLQEAIRLVEDDGATEHLDTFRELLKKET